MVFLDIQMPRVTGLEMVGMLDPGHRPAIVFLTAFEEYALQAFEEDAFDYLLKPVEKERLDKTLNRLRQGQIRPGGDPGTDRATALYPVQRAQPYLADAG